MCLGGSEEEGQKNKNLNQNQKAKNDDKKPEQSEGGMVELNEKGKEMDKNKEQQKGKEKKGKKPKKVAKDEVDEGKDYLLL